MPRKLYKFKYVTYCARLLNMHRELQLNPYAGNILIDQLEGIPDRLSALKSLLYLPEIPGQLDGIPKHIRLHQLMVIRDLHIPPTIEAQLLQSIDLMVRQGYRYRDPRFATTWTAVSGEARHSNAPLPQAFAAAVEGISGVGKTQACLRCLNYFQRQTVDHESFPKLVGGLQQVVRLSVEVPPSGKASDLARSLMDAWQLATGSRRFEYWLSKDRIPDPMRALDEWRQVAVSHFLGVLHLDEIQNLFKLKSLKQRTSRQGKTEAPELSIQEDQVLRWLLYLTNSGQIPILFSGTPDGIGALTKRLSTLERLNTAGYHAFEPFTDAMASDFRKTFLPQLGQYQYVQNRLAVDDNLARLLIELTGGIHRIMIALWVAAHRVAFERQDDSLRLQDFTVAAATWLAPVAPAVAAIRSKDANKMAMYEDLAWRDTNFWAKFWQNPIV